MARFRIAALLLALPITATAEPPRADEPKAATASAARAAEYLDGVTRSWLRDNNCASCHTGYPYLLARPLVSDSPAVKQVRQFFEDRVSAWDRGGKNAGLLQGEGVIKDTEGITEVVAIAATLAMHDATATGKLQPSTRLALAKMWELQRDDGAWAWNREHLAPLEFDDYFGAVYAALGVGRAPEEYANSEAAKPGVARLRAYFAKNPPPNLHHTAWLLWASVHLDGLMTPAQREVAVKELRAKQRPDGGWCLPSLGDWTRLDDSPNDPQAASDGYATGLVLYALRQAGVPAADPDVQKGVAWLKANQRASGRWFTRSLNTDRKHYITNTGTALSIMALSACEAAKPKREP